MKIYKDPQVNIIQKTKEVLLGKHTSYVWKQDPKHLVFSLSRYKFVSKIFDEFENVLEIGAGDGFQSKIVEQNVKKLSLTDIDARNIKTYKNKGGGKINYFLHDFSKEKLLQKFDGIFALDVLEHISKKIENKFISNIIFSLEDRGTLIMGMPTKESQKYASKISKLGHINCKSKSELKKLMKKYFSNVYMFSMNDEVVHTGFDKMSHYIIALCTCKL